MSSGYSKGRSESSEQDIHNTQLYLYQFSLFHNQARTNAEYYLGRSVYEYYIGFEESITFTQYYF